MAARRKPKRSPAPAKPASGVKSKGGRPSDYRPEICDVVRKLAFLGLTDEEMAEVIGKPIGTFDRWKAKHAEFREAIKEGKTPADADVATSLFRRANGYEWDEQQAIKVKEVKFDASGKKIAEIERVEVVTVHRVVPPDTMAGMYWLNNRQRESGRWRHKVDHEHGGKGGGPIILYADDEGL